MHSDLDVCRDIPGYKAILKAVLRTQIQMLIDQLSDQVGEEAVLLTASVTDGSSSHLGSQSGKVFAEDHAEIRSQFLGYCLKRHHTGELGDSTENAYSKATSLSTKRQKTHSRTSLPHKQVSASQPNVDPVSTYMTDIDGDSTYTPHTEENAGGNYSDGDDSLEEEVANHSEDQNKAHASKNNKKIERKALIDNIDNAAYLAELVRRSSQYKGVKGDSQYKGVKGETDERETNLDLNDADKSGVDHLYSSQWDSPGRLLLGEGRLLLGEGRPSYTVAVGDADTSIQEWETQIIATTAYDNSPSNRGPQQCGLCGKMFKNSNNLAVHQRIHTGLRPFKCDMCPKSFTQRSTLLAHRRTHTGEKPYACDICSKSFAQKSTLNNHRLTHVKTEPHDRTELSQAVVFSSPEPKAQAELL